MKATLDKTKLDIEIKRAEEYLQKGNLIQALQIFEELQKKDSKEAILGASKCRDLLLKRYWKQQKPEAFLALVKDEPKYSLVKAKFLGKNALESLAKENSEEGFWARTLLFPTNEEAFKYMSENPKFKKLGVAWLSLIHGDLTKAIMLFLEAKKDDNLRSKIALGIAFLMKKNLFKALECFSSFYPIFKKQFPLLSKALKWDGSKSLEILIEEQKLLQLLQKGSKEEIEKILPEISNQHKELKGRLYLRLGDLVFSKNKDISCVAFWKKAKSYHSEFETDVLKREFLFYFYAKDVEKTENACIDFYFHLYRKNKQLAKDFLENIAFNLVEFYHKKIKVPFLTNEQKWQVANPPIEAFLFLLMKIALRSESLLYFFPIEETHFEGIKSWCHVDNFDKQIFSTLDKHYSKNEIYLKQKRLIAHVYKYHKEERRAICQLIELNPLLKDEFIAHFVRTINEDATDAINCINFLLSICPSDFDLISLSVSFSGTEIKMKKLEYQFSSSLLQVLKLQIDFYKRKLNPNFYKDPFIYGVDKEADLRYFALLLKSKKIPKKYYEEALNKILDSDGYSDEKLISILRKIYMYGYFDLPGDILKYWKKNYPLSWGWQYYWGLKFLKKNDIDKGGKYFKNAFKKIAEDVPEYTVIVQTMDYLWSRKLFRNKGLL